MSLHHALQGEWIAPIFRLIQVRWSENVMRISNGSIVIVVAGSDTNRHYRNWKHTTLAARVVMSTTKSF